ncbi:MAG TPA: hypothetical protein VKH65_11195, partial [Myxococcales bacterium]|nr:hypothetical protein [Myxococcales bacterium]
MAGREDALERELATANTLDPIPVALRDRMEPIEIPGYSEEEKLYIAERHLLPRLLAEHGLRAPPDSAWPNSSSTVLTVTTCMRRRSGRGSSSRSRRFASGMHTIL